MLMRYRPIQRPPTDPRLGRFIPDDWDHYEKYGFSKLATGTAPDVEKKLRLPWWHWSHDQGREGACAGFATAMTQAITNSAENRAKRRKPATVHYDPWWLWNQAKDVDEWPDTNPGDSNGTSVRATYTVMQTIGMVKYDLRRTVSTPRVMLGWGVDSYYWADTVDQVRTALALNVPVTIGVNWYTSFDKPVERGEDHWIGTADLGAVRGGHCVCIYGASDSRQAVRIKNSWGRDYPLVWMPYPVLDRLLKEDGEAGVAGDHIEP